MEEKMADLRRYPRTKVDWPVVLEVGDRHFHLQTVNLSPVGAEVGPVDEPLEIGSTARLSIRPPSGRTFDISAIVWRAIQTISPLLFFVGVDGDADVYRRSLAAPLAFHRTDLLRAPPARRRPTSTYPRQRGGTMGAEARIKELGLTLPQPAQAREATTCRACATGNLLFLSGRGPEPRRGRTRAARGKVGRDLSAEEGYKVAREVGVNLLGSAQRASWAASTSVKRVVKVLGMVNAAEGFGEQPKVINGFSDLMVEVFGDARPARPLGGGHGLELPAGHPGGDRDDPRGELERLGASDEAGQLAQRVGDAWAVPGRELAVDQMDAALARQTRVGVEVDHVGVAEAMGFVGNRITSGAPSATSSSVTSG